MTPSQDEELDEGHSHNNESVDSASSENRRRLENNNTNNLEVKIIEGTYFHVGGGAKKSGNAMSPMTLKPADAYVSVKLAKPNTEQGINYKTKTIKKSASPQWNETFWFCHDINKPEYINVQVYNHNRIGSADLIGEVNIPLKELIANQPNNKEYEVTE